MWQPVVICGLCTHSHTCRRRVAEPCTFAIVCQWCEASLSVAITPGELTIQQSVDSQNPGAPFYLVGAPVSYRSGVQGER